MIHPHIRMDFLLSNLRIQHIVLNSMSIDHLHIGKELKQGSHCTMDKQLSKLHQYRVRYQMSMLLGMVNTVIDLLYKRNPSIYMDRAGYNNLI